MATRPFPLTCSECRSKKKLQGYTEKLLRREGIRWPVKRAREIAANFRRLEDGLWSQTFTVLKELREAKTASAQMERTAADFVDKKFMGFGPKQSRNLLQMLGLTVFEIPIDSRVTKWLNKFGFPVKLSADGLADRNYYNFVSYGFQLLCAKCDILPCLLDAAIFSSFDKKK